MAKINQASNQPPKEKIRILLAEDESEIRELVVFQIESNFNAEIVEVESGNAAIKKLEENPKFDFVVSDYRMNDGNGGELFQYIKKKGYTIPFILCSGNNPKDCPELAEHLDLITHAAKPDLNKVSDSIYALLTSLAPRFDRPEYVSIRLNTLHEMGALKADVYIKLGDSKYLKICQKDDLFSTDDIQKYEGKGLTHAFVKSADAQTLISDFTKDLDTLLKAKEIPAGQALQLSRKSLNLVYFAVGATGVTPEVQNLTKQSADLALKTIGSAPDLADFLAKCFAPSDSSDFLADHSIAIGHFACSIAAKMGWSSELTSYKLIMAGLLHDVTLAVEKVKRLKELDSSTPAEFAKLEGLTLDERTFFKTHPIQAANLAKEFKQIPPEVDLIIAQHHERPDGSGFPNQLTHELISPLGALFLVAHDLMLYLHSATGRTVADYLASLPESYKVGQFRKIYLALV